MLQRIKASDKKITNLAYALNDINKLKKQHIELYERQVLYIKSFIGTLEDYYYFFATIYVRTDDNRDDLYFQFSFRNGAVRIYLLNNSIRQCTDLSFFNLNIPLDLKKIIIDNMDVFLFS